ncbi:MAG: DUF4340 domain-containing protein [Dehalococcoidales bacterium]|nr:MAG: DUF4340 domain-containing protein [Dehalococcoidales bacterium]
MKLRSILILVAILAVATAVYFATRPVEEPPPTPDPKPRVWAFEMEELEHVLIELPRLDMRESFIKHEDRQWYFDDLTDTQVDSDRWGGGIPLILSGPLLEKIIAEDATEERLTDFGLTSPSMKIILTTEDEEITNIEAGDANPDGSIYYIRLAESNNVYAINSSWYEVLERLVLEPPYPSEDEE